MSVKALKRQLIAAIAMVLVATIAMGSSTYAWFVNNTEVTAQGMSVNAAADDSLLIRGTEDGEYTSVGTNALSILTLHPSTSIDGVNFGKLGSSVRVQSAAASNATWSGASGEFASGDIVTATNVTTSGSESYYYAETTYSLKSVANDADVYVKAIDVTDTADMFKAVRVSVTVGSTTYIYNPAGTNTAGKVGQLTGSAWALAAENYNDINNDSVVWSLTADTATDAVVRIWFEGQDEDCFTDNIETTGTNITITFAKA